MLTLLSPAKTLDLDTPVPPGTCSTQPRLLKHAQELIDVLVTKSPTEIAKLMHLSDALAELNVQRYADFTVPFTAQNARPALYTFAGDVYVGLDAFGRFDARDVTESQKTLRILSGLYGVLRPLDLIQAYRLEMGTKLTTETGKDLYAYWSSTLTELLAADLAASPGAKIVINLASAEYFDAVDPHALGGPVISPRFEDRGPRGEWKIITLWAKQARGKMAGWLVRHRVRTLKGALEFDEDGYHYAPTVSTPDVPVFRREK